MKTAIFQEDLLEISIKAKAFNVKGENGEQQYPIATNFTTAAITKMAMKAATVGNMSVVVAEVKNYLGESKIVPVSQLDHAQGFSGEIEEGCVHYLRRLGFNAFEGNPQKLTLTAKQQQHLDKARETINKVLIVNWYPKTSKK